MRKLPLPLRVFAAATFAIFCSANAFADSYTVTYTGQGLTADGFGGYDLKLELCGVANGADVDGPYLLWVMTATNATSADISGPWGVGAMTKKANGAFQFVSNWYDPRTLIGVVNATYDKTSRNPQLVISHGCRPFNKIGAWCSPGFWRNATDVAWALTGRLRTDLFNSTAVSSFYDTALGANPSLQETLDNNAYKSGTLTRAPYNLTPFNATGAFLTNNIPGYSFSPSLISQSDSQTCPIDHFGNFKH